MKINEECIRDILSYLANNLTIKISNNNKGDFNSISLLSLMKFFDNKYSKEDIWYSIYNLSQDRFIEQTIYVNKVVMGLHLLISTMSHIEVINFTKQYNQNQYGIKQKQLFLKLEFIH